MATIIEAFSKYGPRLKRQPTVQLEQLATRLAELTGLRESQTMLVLLELRSAILHYGRRGAGLKLPGIGTFRPSLRGDGQLRLLYRADLTLRRDMDSLGQYTGEILNSENIGLDPVGYKALWDEEHPEDPMELPSASSQAA